MIDFKGLPEWASISEGFLVRWLEEIAAGKDVKVKNLAYYFVDDEEILRINRSFLNHNYYTDIITFGYEEGRFVSGEVYISFQTVATNAARFGVERSNELQRVIAHGLLHLIGFDDKSDDEKRVMKAEEEKCLILQSKILKDN